jgi:hypothetical protein
MLDLQPDKEILRVSIRKRQSRRVGAALEREMHHP